MNDPLPPEALGAALILLVVVGAFMTGDLVYVKQMGLGIAAAIAIDAPLARVCSAEVPMPYARHLEEAALPQPETIAAAARQLVGRHG